MAPGCVSRGAGKMPLIVRVRSRGGSVSVVIPAALAKSMDWGPGTQVQIEPVGPDMLTLRRARASAAPT